MPALAEWMMHYPADWTVKQAQAYMHHTLRVLTQAIVPTNQALGPSATAGILLAVVGVLAQNNRLAARDICNLLANAYDTIEALDPLREATAKQ